MPRIYDAHVHVWVLDPDRYPWHSILAQAKIPDHPFTADQLKAQMDAAGVERAVLVQPSTYGWDHGYLSSVLGTDRERFRGVGLVDPAGSDIARAIHALAQLPGMRGLRFHLLDDDHERQFGKTWRPISEAAAAARLVLTFQAAPCRLALVRKVSTEFPELRIVIDHLGLIRWKGPDSDGLGDLVDLADRPNIYVKLSGLEVIWGGAAPFDAAAPLVSRVVDAFSPRRVMWGSNAPHALAAGSYRELARVVDACLPSLDEQSRKAIRWDTAEEIWG